MIVVFCALKGLQKWCNSFEGRPQSILNFARTTMEMTCCSMIRCRGQRMPQVQMTGSEDAGSSDKWSGMIGLRYGPHCGNGKRSPAKLGGRSGAGKFHKSAAHLIDVPYNSAILFDSAISWHKCRCSENARTLRSECCVAWHIRITGSKCKPHILTLFMNSPLLPCMGIVLNALVPPAD